MKNIIVGWLSLVMLIFLCDGCSRQPLGTWRADNGETFEFQKDGSFNFKNMPRDPKQGVIEMHGNYTMPDAKHLQMQVKMPGEVHATTYLFSVNGEDLSLQDTTSQQVKLYHRAKD